MTTLTVAVVSWNTRDLLERCLRSLEADSTADVTEVWVVDNASSDGSADMVRERFPWVKLITAEENLGFGPAVNLVAARTATPFLAAANADIEVEPGALAALLAAAEEHPGTGAAAPRLVTPDGRTQHSVYAFPTVGFTLFFNLGLYRLLPGSGDALCLEGRWDPEREREVDWAVGAFLLLTREAWEAAGGFDESQWMYAEDLDLGWRLARRGWTTRYVPRARVRHVGGASTRQSWGEATTDRWLRSTYGWLLRRRGLAVTRLVALLNLAGAGARWLGFGALAWLRPGRFARDRDAMRGWFEAHRVGLAPRSELASHR
ncbi:MAG TPA: glycosyltransferase family 2 protein [Solirubrobacterales bacterium]|nr:glycosyltransferase family 2 protein [Solirubrobacterales bacterium]